MKRGAYCIGTSYIIIGQSRIFKIKFQTYITNTNDTSKGANTSLNQPVETGTPPSSGSQFAAELRGFGPVGIIAIILIIFSGNVFIGNVVLPIGAILVLLWMRLSHTPWREIGYIRPKSWILSLVVGLAFGILFKLIMKAVVMPVLGADPVNQAYHYLKGNTAMLPAAIWAMLVAGFGEETVFRGWLFERLGKLFGNSIWAKTWMILISAVIFGLGHYANQGVPGVEQALIFGIVFGAIFATTGRLFMLMVAHAAFDLTALAIIYSGLESEVAHFLFK